jgi:GntR family transcriptional regulator
MADPLYSQVTDTLRTRIIEGLWGEGDRVPAESELCREFGVSSITVRRAVANLVAEGLLVRWQGRGTFVTLNGGIVQGPPQLTSFTNEIVSRGWRPGARVVSVRTEAARADVATKLGLKPLAQVTILERVRLADGVPVARQIAHLPALLFPGLERHDFEHESLYDVLKDAYGTRPTTATELYRAINVRGDTARLLQVEVGSPAFSVERVSSDASRRRIELVSSVIRGDKYTVAIRLSATKVTT